jgi:3'-phosphoadenosine 5'-phosphosulfate sulfotransferase (PAPS reductase)/FAD synthetase
VTFQDGIFKVHPILRWRSQDVYYYMEHYGLPQHPLWEKGYTRVGDWHTTQRGPGGVDGATATRARASTAARRSAGCTPRASPTSSRQLGAGSSAASGAPARPRGTPRDALRPAVVADHRVRRRALDAELAVRAADLVADRDARAPELGHGGGDHEVVVVARRAAIAARRLDHAEIEPARDVDRERVAHAAEELGAADLEEAKVVAVVDDPHRIAVAEDDAVACDLDHGRRGTTALRD